MNQLPTGLLPVAGIPWFAVPFGRDSLITSLQTLCLNPDIAYGTLRFLAQHQGRKWTTGATRSRGRSCTRSGGRDGRARRSAADAVLRQRRLHAALHHVSSRELVRWTGDWALADELRPNARAALEWLRGLRRPRRRLASSSTSRDLERGIPTRAGKTPSTRSRSPRRSAGRAADRARRGPGLRLCARSRQMAEIYRRWGESSRAAALARARPRRRQRFERHFWLEDEQFYAMALDAEKRPVPSVSSNPGHCLLAGLLDATRAARRRAPAREPGHAVRLGHSYPEQRGAVVQPDELPQRLGLAARQLAGCGRPAARRV